MTHAFVFPGQGSQFVGMGKDIYDTFPVAREVFEEVDETLKQNLTRTIFEGPEKDLILTINAQPALMAVSLAVLRVILKESGKKAKDIVSCVAGHSLGEYTALVTANALNIHDCTKLLRIRAHSMYEAVPGGQGAMAAILGLDVDTMRRIVKQASNAEEFCMIANDNCPGQIVISGHINAVQKAMALAKEDGSRRTLLLPVSGPFHSDLMEPAAERMQDALNQQTFKNPTIPIVTNVTANYEQDPHTLKALLIEQITKPVRWRESIEQMVNHSVTTIIEIGAGKVLTGLTKRINPNVSTVSVGTPQDIENLIKKI